MSATVWLLARTLEYPTAGGAMWPYLNWALGLRAAGCRVVWLEGADASAPPDRVQTQLLTLERRLALHGLGNAVALCARDGAALPPQFPAGNVPYDQAGDADLLLDMAYGPAALVRRFRRTAFLDIDPGLCQLWISRGQIDLPEHDCYWSIGETVGRPGARFPDCGVSWHYTPPCVALDAWPAAPASPDSPFTTVSNWIMYDYWVDDDAGGYANDKRTGFLPFLDLPQHTAQPLELALSLGGADEERAALERRGWRVVEAHDTVPTPEAYRTYISRSRGEFSCAKPSCIRLQNAWVSDRTVCYLASGRPAVVQHTGPSRVLPDGAGLFRFSSIDEAARQLEIVASDWERQSRLARALAEELFDARTVVPRMLERALH